MITAKWVNIHAARAQSERNTVLRNYVTTLNNLVYSEERPVIDKTETLSVASNKVAAALIQPVSTESCTDIFQQGSHVRSQGLWKKPWGPFI